MANFFCLLLLVYSLFSLPALAQTVDDYNSSLTSDFEMRDGLSPTDVPPSEWETCCGSFGPWPSQFPVVTVPIAFNPLQWKRDRVIEVAKHYIGLPYRHFHIPAMGGLDCSNFTAWVYNYGFGIMFRSNVHVQAETAGRRLLDNEELIKGDLIYIFSRSGTEISHVAIYIDENHIIDSTSTDGPIKVRHFTGWYKTRFAWARRILE